ncbi:cleft lip and palate associated transmembrane protein 1 [Amniculicola lignicola CBS 123094]|uniref:Cleft lip and palate associated transmembrane protein 1 n=1 Tax=Amniculicola lignicola CBS 123094 TaxID=1392246 RepID=A0A6A5W5N7_9PLEO|nr:cleft lip and palate associated transmembrane protein 1 [Amniculicola lignicola CBS 123094]
MPEPRQQEQQGSGAGGLVKTLVQSVGIFFLIQFASKPFFPGNTQASTNAVADPVTGAKPVAANAQVKIPMYEKRPHQLAADAQYSVVPHSIAPMWPVGTELDILMYISPSQAMPSLTQMPKEALLIEERGFKFGDWEENREIHTEFAVPKAVQQNATLYSHFYIGKSGSVLDPTASGYDVSRAYHFARPLTEYLGKKKIAKVRNLLSDMPEVDGETEEEKKAPKIIASYYHPNFTLSFVPDSGVVGYPTMHPGPRSFFELEASGARDASGSHGWYYPVLYVNTFWQLNKQKTELNESVTILPMNVKLNNLGNWKFNLMASMDANIKASAQAALRGETSPTGSDGSEMEVFKEILLDSNSYLLGLTAVVSVLHMIFEMLAFKNDVAHWRKKKDNVGTSVRTILANVFMQLIIFLYLMDNNENTSWMILFGQGMGIAIEAWKITKSVNVRVRPTAPGSLLPYSVVFEDKHVLSETEKKTDEYDKIAFKYMYMLAVPLLLAYAAYSLAYDSHKSWYSFIIKTLVGSVYAYGFLMMVPSLYINYRLKSVAHMPGRAMTYKVLSTFIDDLFAFTIKMPTLHRLATLRDDVIFFVYLYQMWKYKVDFTRVNEFGQGGDDEEEEAKLADKPLSANADADKTADKGVAKEITAESKATGAEKGTGKGRKRK